MTDSHCDTVASCEFESGYLDPSQQTNNGSSIPLVVTTKATPASTLPCMYSSRTTVVRLNVMDRTKQGVRWTSDHFHPQLKQAVNNVGVGCCFQARARESLFVAFSPTPHSVSKGKMWLAEFGSDGNTRTTLRHGSQHVRPLGRIATSERAWKDYWVCLLLTSSDGGGGEKFLAGYGTVPGEHCVAVLDGKAENVANSHTSQPSTEEGESEGAGGTEPSPAEGSTTPRTTSSVDTLFLGFGNGGGDIRSAGTPLSIRHIRFFPLPEAWNETLLAATPDHLTASLLDGGSAAADGSSSDLASAGLLQEYQRECDKQRARARKFGLDYKEPPLTAFAAWSEARRLQLNPKEGFVTGIDLLSSEERAKQEARQRRFGGGGATSSADDSPPDTANLGAEDVTKSSPERTLAVDEAWDNDDKAHQFRIDPPRSLWKPSPNSETNDAEDDVLDEDNPATFAEEKVHMFSIDWAPFKQIRTNEIMAYFALYGPSYVEWLGDLSCNILFQDKFSAARALHNLSIEIPSPPLESVVAEGRLEGEASAAPPIVDDDLGRMGWRLGKTMLRKTTNDRFGRRGTSARVLLRVATSLDVLQERPTSWPKPPKWFTTGRVLLPKRHLPKRDPDRERKRRSDPSRTEQWNPRSGDEHPLLSQGLASSRGQPTDSTKELERAAKRTKISE